MIKAIKEWFWPSIPKQVSRWSCQKHGANGPSIAFYGKDGKRMAACVRCICEAFPLDEVKK